MEIRFKIPPLTIEENRKVKGGFSPLSTNPPPDAEIENMNCAKVLARYKVKNWNCICVSCTSDKQPGQDY